jgi:hypothetical protein
VARNKAEFSDRVKDNAIKRWHKLNPGRENEIITVHHRVSIWAGKELGIPTRVLKSGENAQAMTLEEHQRFHDNEPTLEEYAVIAQGLLGIRQLRIW